MKRPPERVFTVRMWTTDRFGRDTAAWRGAVYDVSTGKTLYVAGPQEVGDCLAAALTATDTEGTNARSHS